MMKASAMQTRWIKNKKGPKEVADAWELDADQRSALRHHPFRRAWLKAIR